MLAAACNGKSNLRSHLSCLSRRYCRLIQVGEIHVRKRDVIQLVVDVEVTVNSRRWWLHAHNTWWWLGHTRCWRTTHLIRVHTVLTMSSTLITEHTTLYNMIWYWTTHTHSHTDTHMVIDRQLIWPVSTLSWQCRLVSSLPGYTAHTFKHHACDHCVLVSSLPGYTAHTFKHQACDHRVLWHSGKTWIAQHQTADVQTWNLLQHTVCTT